MSKDNKHSKVNDEAGSDESAAKRGVVQQSQDAIRHQEDASHHKGTQHGGDDGSTGQRTQGGSPKDTGGMTGSASELAATNRPRANAPTHKGGNSK